MFEWCSIAEMTTSSPRPTCDRPCVAATRLTASVVPRTKTISCGRRAFRNRATVARAASLRVGRALAQPVHAAVNVRVFLEVEAAPIDDRLRLLCRRRVVEIDEGAPWTCRRRIGKSWRIAVASRGAADDATGGALVMATCLA
jgi:hypothetical protein